VRRRRRGGGAIHRAEGGAGQQRLGGVPQPPHLRVSWACQLGVSVGRVSWAGQPPHLRVSQRGRTQLQHQRRQDDRPGRADRRDGEEAAEQRAGVLQTARAREREDQPRDRGVEEEGVRQRIQDPCGTQGAAAQPRRLSG
jgi:hypothetical protein